MAWRVPIQTIIDRGYDLDIKNPNSNPDEIEESSIKILERIDDEQNQIHAIVSQLKELIYEV